MAKLLTHQIRVETEEENVTVMIGGDGGVPGGFAKFFNRVIDSQAWARLSDAARAAYIPLVRFADQRNHFRVQVGQAALMKYAGLSRSSVKRAMKDLLTSKLLVLVEQGGVTPDGQNECNVYQLMVPTDPKPRAGRAATPTGGVPTPGSAVNPPGARTRTPSRFSAEPPAGPTADPGPVPARTDRGGRLGAAGGSGNEPLFRSVGKEQSEDSSRRPAASAPAIDASPEETAAALLIEKGVEPTAARELAAAYPYERVVDVVATMEYRKARGKCDNPGGFIRDALVRQWQTPAAVVDARRRAEARLRQQAAEDQARRQRQADGARAGERAGDDERRVEAVIDSLDDDELAILAQSVLKKYEGNSAVLQVLTRKPPRECRLMKMEVAAMLGRAT